MHKCDKCPKEFTKPMGLRIHKWRSHTPEGAKAYKNAAARRWATRRQNQLDEKAGSFDLPVAPQQQDAREATQPSPDQRPGWCRHCDRRFKSLSGLAGHLRRFHPIAAVKEAPKRPITLREAIDALRAEVRMKSEVADTLEAML